MAVLYIAEFRHASTTAEGFVTSQTVAVGASTFQSAAFNAATRHIRIVTDTTCLFETWGTNPVADATSPLLPANSVEYFRIDHGKSWKLACKTP